MNNGYITKQQITGGYNIFSIALIYALICIGPLPVAGSIPVYVAFVLSCYRLLRYDVETYILDMVVLLPLSNIYKFAPQTPSIYLYLILLGCAYFIFKGNVKIRGSLVLCALYFLDVSVFLLDAYVSIVASLLFLALYASNIKGDLVIKVAILFSISVALSSLWAFIFKDTNYFEPYILEEMQLSKMSDLLRFKGLFVDPNYFGTFLLLAITIVFQLYLCDSISMPALVALVSVDVFAGLLTFSKSFLLTIAALMMLLCYFVWKNRSKAQAIGVSICLAICLVLAFFGKISAVSSILERFEGQSDMNDITTGRYELWERYYNEITSGVGRFFVGHGLDAPLLIQGSHNLYLETMYYIGFVGLLMLILLTWKYFKPFIPSNITIRRTEKLVGSLSVIVFVVLYWSLQGMFSFTTYVQLSIAVSMLYIPYINKK